jgi:hypothetical protein
VPSSHQKILELVREWFPAAAASLTNKVSRQQFTDFCTQQVGGSCDHSASTLTRWRV